MSGPKTSRYTLTAEQRRILAEQRRIQQETQKNVMLMKQNVSELKEVITRIDRELSQYERIVAETGDTSYFINYIKQVRERAIKAINDAGTVSEKSGLDSLKTDNDNLKIVNKILTSYEQEMSEELNKVDKSFRKEVESDISEGFTISFLKIEEDNSLNIVDFISKIDTTLNEIRRLQLSESLKEKFRILKEKAAEIESVDFIENFYAMSILPFLKECRAYNSVFQEYGAQFVSLYMEYQMLSDKLGIPKKTFKFSMEALYELNRIVQEMQTIIQKKEEQEYISKCVDTAMREMGYKIIGEREIVKKDGHRFTNELFLFDEGTAVNVTYGSEGQITMELGGIDDKDRIPTDLECQSLAQDMASFCDDYLKIEKRLKEIGVVSNRISILPPDEQFAQIINTSDYEMKENVGHYEAKKSRRVASFQEHLRRGE